jgi:MATE family multidrug resistance protein
MSVSHSSTLSPTREDDSEAEEEEEEEEEEVVESREELRRGSASTSTHHYTTFIAPPTETTPLIAATPSSSSSSLVDEPNKPGPTAARRELGIILGYTLPICGTHFLEYSLMVVTVISVGHIGTIELAAASLASITSNVFALVRLSPSLAYPLTDTRLTQ